MTYPPFIRQRCRQAVDDLTRRYDGPIPAGAEHDACWLAIQPTYGKNTPEQIGEALEHFSAARLSAACKRKATWRVYQSNLDVPAYHTPYRGRWDRARADAINMRAIYRAWRRECEREMGHDRP